MIGLSIQIMKIHFRVFLSGIWLIPAFVVLCWNPFFPFLIKAVEAAELSENQGQSQPAEKNSQINLQELSIKDSLPKTLVIDDGPGGLLLKSQNKYDFSTKGETEIDIFQKKSSEIEDSLFTSNLAYNDPDNQLEIFRLKQKFNSFDFGMEYRYVGENLKDPKDYKKKTNTKTKVDFESDQEGVELWGAKKIGPIGLKPFYSRFYDNVDRNPKKTRMLTNEYGLDLKYKMDTLPIYFSVSHSRRQSENTVESNSSEYQAENKESYGGSLYYYGGKVFNMTASSSYSPSKNPVDPNEETHSYWHEISASISPVSNLTIMPTVSFGEYQYLWYGEKTENPSMSLSITRSRLLNMIDLSLWGGFSQSRSTDGYQDSETLNTSLEISWDAKYLFFPKSRFSWDLGYDQYDDKIYQNSSYDSFSTSLQLKFQL